MEEAIQRDLNSDFNGVGEKLQVFKYPHPVLKKVAEPVTEFDADLEQFCKNLLHTMYTAPGIGLAAPQVGVSKRIFVLDISYQREDVTLADGSKEKRCTEFNPLVFINPVLKELDGEQLHEEGCLSLPGLYESVKRYSSLEVEYQNCSGEVKSMKAEELLSVCIQHENDHLEGIVFLNRLSLLKKNLLKKKFLKKKKNK
ncbi:MAG: peptide deformylase [Halobacteriovoraceae bacterium]|nr:peptide deformylase [Halobacteriovoraceae bacterium]